MAKTKDNKANTTESKPGEQIGKTEAGSTTGSPSEPVASTPVTSGGSTGTSNSTAPLASTAIKKRGRTPGRGPKPGKKLRNHLKNVKSKLAKEGVVPLKKGLTLLKSIKRAKFDETVEVHIKLGIDTTSADQMVRGTVPLPYGKGKAVRVIVFCQGDDVNKAKEAGADFAGSDELIKKIQTENWVDFDVALATQSMMGQVSRLGKILGPRNLMPTPKAGTVVPANSDVGAAVKEFKAGKVEYRADKSGNVHAGVGKLSFDEEKLQANVQALVDQVRAAKPSGVKGNYVESISICSSMSPSIRITM